MLAIVEEVAIYAGNLLLTVIPILFAALFIVELARRYFGEEKLSYALAGKSAWGARLRAGVLGALLPFCECGAFPVGIALIKGGVPVSAVLAFFLISPVLSVPAFFILGGLFGFTFAAIYAVVTFMAGITAALLLEKAGVGRGAVKLDDPQLSGSAGACCSSEMSIPQSKVIASNINMATGPNSGCESKSGSENESRSEGGSEGGSENASENASASASASVSVSKSASGSGCGCGSEQEGSSLSASNPAGKGTSSTVEMLQEALRQSLLTLKQILPYILAAVVVAGLLVSLIPPESMETFLARGGIWGVPLGTLLGIPVYQGDCAMISVVAPLIKATGAVGPGIAFIIAGSGTSINGIILLNALFNRKFIVGYVVSVIAISLLTGYILQLLG